MKLKRCLFCMLAAGLTLFFCGLTVEAGSVFTSPYVEIAPDGKAWTTSQELWEYDGAGLPGFWYTSAEADFKTGVQPALQQPGPGGHYYRYDRSGALPIGEWKIAWRNPRCVQGDDLWKPGRTYHGITPGSCRCGQPYFSGWFAYCADCLEPIRVNIYMSAEAAHTITELPLGMDYYYLCPSCSHLEQGSTIEHRCKGISSNRYKVEYDKNADDAAGSMADSLHMYNNADTYEGRPVTPVKALSSNRYSRMGYKFQGWNTEPDGTGKFFADGQEICNLTEENYDGITRRGIVTLYAQWQRVESSLVFDAAGGSYRGENPMRGGYGESCILTGDLVAPPAGHTVSFQTNGGSYIPPVTGTRSFERWEAAGSMSGRLEGQRYRFLGDMGAVDRVKAVYSFDSITLPTPERTDLSFGGWYFDEDLTEFAGFGGDFCRPDGDIMLYARWVELRLYSTDNYEAWDGRGAADLRWEQPDNVNKTYKLYQSGDGVRYEQISACPYEGPGIDRVFSFEERSGRPVEQTVTVPSTGFYTLTANGAQGGDYGDYKGGLGGSVSGKFYLSEGEKLTVTVGGQNGVNGGGAGTHFGNGGGMTQISSDLKGVLLTAGGGGGASSGGDGLPGGADTGFIPEGSDGADGMAGGGGGYIGGMAGEHILHHHINTCYVKAEENYLASGKAAVTRTDILGDCDEDGNIFPWDEESLADDAGRAEEIIVLKTSQASTDGATGMYTEFAWATHWGEHNLAKTRLKIVDQDGRVLKEQTVEQILDMTTFHNGASINDLDRLCCRFDIRNQCEPWLQRLSEYTFSSLVADFRFVVTPSDEGYDKYHFEVYPVTDGTRNWVHAEVTDLETGEVFKNEDGRPYRQEGILSEIRIERACSALEGWDVWNTGPGNRIMTMRLGCEFDESVTAVSVEAQAVRKNDHPGFHYDTLDSLVMQVDKKVCGKKEGQIVSSKPAYGGSSCVNTDYTLTLTDTAGCVSGNGSAEIKAEETGLTEELELKGVKAFDITAPFAIAQDSISKTVRDSGSILVTFQPVEDRGSEYYFKAESYYTLTGERMCTSNVTKNTLITGLKGYYYLIDKAPATVVTASNADNASEPLAEEQLAVELKAFTQYLHLAAADKAGNLSETVHIEISQDDPGLYWPLYTEDIFIDSTVGGTDYQNVYPADDDRSYYVKADGETPFLLSFASGIDGKARENYQIDHQIFDVRDAHEEVLAQRYGTKIPYSIPLDSDALISGVLMESWISGQTILQDAMYAGAERSNQARDMNFYQAFTLDSVWNGRTVTVTPSAGASTRSGVMYSAWDQDAAHALRLVADSEAPVITGLEALQSVELINRNDGSVVVEIQAFDELSGIREFYLRIENLENYGTAVYEADEDGVVQVEITRKDPIFNGDFVATAYAVDNVGNEREESWYVTEFALEAEVERILAPHEPVFKRGESGILSITAWGYVDKVEVKFPDFLSEYSQTIDYDGYSDYREDEKIQFMIPLYMDEGSGYEITVRVYKGDRKLEAYPEIRTIQVKDSVLDEIRTRLRG